MIGLLIVSFSILVHELGHALVAIWLRLRVPRIAIGFGPLILGLRSTGLLWQVNLPFGRVLTLCKSTSAPRAYDIRLFLFGGYIECPALQKFRTPFHKRVLVAIAGPTVNLLTATVCVGIMIAQAGGSFWDVVRAPLLLAVATWDAVLKINGANIQGPVGIVTNNHQNVLESLLSISMSFFLFNMLPLLPLDGGKVVIACVERWRKRPLSKKQNLIVGLPGIVLLFIFFVTMVVVDIVRLF